MKLEFLFRDSQNKIFKFRGSVSKHIKILKRNQRPYNYCIDEQQEN